jgi:hypothetical protein
MADSSSSQNPGITFKDYTIFPDVSLQHHTNQTSRVNKRTEKGGYDPGLKYI